MRASSAHFWCSSYPGVDPEFDEMGGELTLHQISDPVPEGDEDTAHYRGRMRAKQEQADYRARVRRQAEALRVAKQEAHKQIREAQYRLIDLAARFHTASRQLNTACRGCIPYNGHYTPYYWSLGQAPYRVEQFLR